MWRFDRPRTIWSSLGSFALVAVVMAGCFFPLARRALPLTPPFPPTPTHTPCTLLHALGAAQTSPQRRRPLSPQAPYKLKLGVLYLSLSLLVRTPHSHTPSHPAPLSPFISCLPPPIPRTTHAPHPRRLRPRPRPRRASSSARRSSAQSSSSSSGSSSGATCGSSRTSSTRTSPSRRSSSRSTASPARRQARRTNLPARCAAHVGRAAPPTARAPSAGNLPRIPLMDR